MIVEQREYCIQWELSLNYGKPLKGDGEVKNGRYLRYALNIRSKEDEAILNGLMLESERLTIEQIRSEYEEKFGSIFI